MHVRVDHAGNTVAELRVDDPCIGRNGDGAADVSDAIASDDDYLVVEERAGTTVERVCPREWR
jgi:hypothetical protein